jgi:hypothetical protein
MWLLRGKGILAIIAEAALRLDDLDDVRGAFHPNACAWFLA